MDYGKLKDIIKNYSYDNYDTADVDEYVDWLDERAEGDIEEWCLCYLHDCYEAYSTEEIIRNFYSVFGISKEDIAEMTHLPMADIEEAIGVEPVNSVEDLINAMNNGKTFEDIVSDYNDANPSQDEILVERCGNQAYYDTDFDEFMHQCCKLTLEKWDEHNMFIYFKSILKDGTMYRIPYDEKENRFDTDLGNEYILQVDEIEKV